MTVIGRRAPDGRCRSKAPGTSRELATQGAHVGHGFDVSGTRGDVRCGHRRHERLHELASGSIAPGKTWAKVDARQAARPCNSTFRCCRSSPTQALRRLEAAGTVTEVGTETIDGVADDALPSHEPRPLEAHREARKSGVWLQRAKLRPDRCVDRNSNGYVYRETRHGHRYRSRADRHGDVAGRLLQLRRARSRERA